MEYVAYLFDGGKLELFAEAEDEEHLRALFGAKSTYTPLEGGGIEIRHPFNTGKPILAFPRSR